MKLSAEELAEAWRWASEVLVRSIGHADPLDDLKAHCAALEAELAEARESRQRADLRAMRWEDKVHDYGRELEVIRRYAKQPDLLDELISLRERVNEVEKWESEELVEHALCYQEMQIFAREAVKMTAERDTARQEAARYREALEHVQMWSCKCDPDSEQCPVDVARKALKQEGREP